MASPTLQQLRTFAAAVDTGTISGAALALNITQPAASQQMRGLERAVGLRLLERAGGRVQPTSAGDAFLVHARRAMASVGDALATAAAYRDGDAGRVRLGTGATACIYLLPPVLALVRERMPKLELIVATGNTTDILRRIETGDLDIGLVTLPARLGRSLSSIHEINDPFVALVPDRLVPGGGPLSPAQLTALPLILYEAAGETRGIINAWFARAGRPPRPVMELGSVEAIKVLVSAGLGAAILPALATATPVPRASVHRLQPATGRTLAVVLRREKRLDRGLRVVLDELTAATPTAEQARQPTAGRRSWISTPR